MRYLDRIAVCFQSIKVLVRIAMQVSIALWRLGRLPQPCVSILGSSSDEAARKNGYESAAHQLAHKLVHNDLSVITGGGPGIMAAANCGAHASPDGVMRTMKVGIRGLPYQEALNTCQGESVTVSDFFSRKWLLFNYSIGFIFFPGGVGTFDEFFDLLNLMKTKKIEPAGIVLIGTAYWQPIVALLDRATDQGYIRNEFMPRISITDDLDEAVAIISSYCRTCHHQ